MSDANQLPARPLQSDRDATRAFEDAGAVSPATARPLHEVPGADPAAVVTLVSRRLVRESGDGRYYLYAGTDHARRRTIFLVSAAIAVLAAGAILVQLAAH